MHAIRQLLFTTLSLSYTCHCECVFAISHIIITLVHLGFMVQETRAVKRHCSGVNLNLTWIRLGQYITYTQG